MEVDSIAAKVATKCTHVAPNIIEVATKIVYLSTMSIIIESKEGIKTFNQGMELELFLWYKVVF